MTTPNLTKNAQWTSTVATITECKLTFASRLFPDGYVSDVINWHEFVVTFTYAALGNNYKGRYKSTLPKAVGEAFPLQFNPAKPQMNSMSAPVQSLWAKVIMWLIALVFVFLLTHYFPDAFAN